jgi:hypothetical protein
MFSMSSLSNIARSAGDPKVVSTGPSSLGASGRLARALGWFSIGLGLTEVLAPHRLTRALGMEGKEGLVRAYGVRELGAGMLTLSVDKRFGLWNRVAGDALDIATLMAAMRPDNPKRENVGIALAAVIGVTLLDVIGSAGTTARHTRMGSQPRDYRYRSGFPQGVAKARGAARDFGQTKAMRSPNALEAVSAATK